MEQIIVEHCSTLSVFRNFAVIFPVEIIFFRDETSISALDSLVMTTNSHPGDPFFLHLNNEERDIHIVENQFDETSWDDDYMLYSSHILGVQRTKISKYNGILQNDKREGYCHGYFTLSSRGNHRHGFKIGHWSYGNDNLTIEGNYINGHADGIWTSIYKGKIVEKMIYENGRLEGPIFINNEDPLDQITGQYHNGEKEGSWSSNSEYGNKKITTEVQYRNGRIIHKKKISIEYYENKQIKSHETEVNYQNHGENTFWHPNGQTKAIKKFRNGNKEGIWRSWYDNGQIKKYKFYQKGQIFGKAYKYFPDGKTKEIFDYDYGYLRKEKRFGEDGQILLEIDYGECQCGNCDGTSIGMTTYQNGVKISWFDYYNEEIQERIYFYPDGKTGQEYRRDEETIFFNEWDQNETLITRGQYKYNFKFGTKFFDPKEPMVKIGTWTFWNLGKKLEKNYVNNVLSGVYRAWYSDGTIEYELNFERGALHGRTVQYSPNGSISAECVFKNGKKNGKEIVINEFVRIEYLYSDGNLNGETVVYYHNGNVKQRVMFVNRKKNGLDLMFDKEGNLISKISFKEGINDGEFTVWYPNQQMLIKGNYQKGKEEGEWTLWNEEGEKKEQGKFKEGKKIGIWAEWNNGKMRKIEYE